MLNRAAREMAAEVAAQEWSDAPWRLDGSRHRLIGSETRKSPRTLDQIEADAIRTNVMWVTAQALLRQDPDLDLHEYAAACGVPARLIFRTDGSLNQAITMGVRVYDDWETEVPDRAAGLEQGAARARLRVNRDKGAGRETPAWIVALAE